MAVPSPRGGSSSRPACTTRSRTSLASASAGRATFCTAPTVTASRCETGSSVSWAARPRQFDMPRSSASGPVTSCTSPGRDTVGGRASAARGPGIAIAEGAALRVRVEDDRLCGVELDGDRTVACDALFVPPRFVPNSDLLAALGCDLDVDGWPITTADGLTSVAGVWVAGMSRNAAPRSSRPPAKGPPQPSPSTPIWSARTCATPSARPPEARAISVPGNEPTQPQEALL